MELKRLVTQLAYRIEPQAEGGFIAYASDANMPSLEAPTREELQQKIQAKTMEGLNAQFPGLFPSGNKEVKFNFYIEHKPGGGFALRSGDPQAQPVEGTQGQMESHLAEKLVGLAEKFSPELKQALEAQGASSNIKVLVDQKTFALKGGLRLSSSTGQELSPGGSNPPQDAMAENAGVGDRNINSANAMGDSLSSAPINPERSGIWTVFLFALAVAAVIALVYLIVHR